VDRLGDRRGLGVRVKFSSANNRAEDNMAIRHCIVFATFAAGAIVAANCASASVVCLNATQGSQNFGPDSSCAAGTELEVKLQDAKDAMKGFGNIATTTAVMEFTSTDALDLASGNATITPAAKGGAASFSNLDITVPGFSFTDVVFGLQLLNTANSGGEDLTVTAWSGATLERSFTYDSSSMNGLPHDALVTFTIADASGLTAVDLSSTTGIKGAKGFDVSGVTVIPEASTWSMMLAGLLGLGFAGYRRARSGRTILAD
jgi:hypothetical protein